MNELAWLKYWQHKKSPPNLTKSKGIWVFLVYGSLVFFIVSCSGFSPGAVPRHSEKGYSCSICSPARSRKLHKSHKKVCLASRADSEVNPSCVIAFNKDPARLNHRVYRNQRASEEFGQRSGKYLSTKFLSRSQNQIPLAVAQQGQGKPQQHWNPAPDQAEGRCQRQSTSDYREKWHKLNTGMSPISGRFIYDRFFGCFFLCWI